MTNFARNICKASSKDVLWTTFNEHRKLMENKGYIKSFAAINSRATNKYKDKSVVMYIGNRFLKPTMKNFFLYSDITTDKDFEDGFALSELIQFIYRSQIRTEKPINVYIPSKRMRKLLIDWLKNQTSKFGFLLFIHLKSLQYNYPFRFFPFALRTL